MKIVINPKYSYLAEFINSLPHETPVPEEVYQDKRNYVYKVTVDGTPVVVKKYKRPTLANCVIYTRFRTGKAERSYKYAFRLKEMGFDTAEPIAYIIQKKYGFLHTCYFVSKHLPYPLLSACLDYDRQILSDVIIDFAEYTYDMHKKGIFHNDYNLGNILFHKEGSKYEFTVIDINRIVFGYKPGRKSIDGLRGLGFPLPLFGVFIERYTQMAGIHTEMFFGALLLKRGIHITKRMKRMYKALMNRVKSVLGKKEQK